MYDMTLPSGQYCVRQALAVATEVKPNPPRCNRWELEVDFVSVPKPGDSAELRSAFGGVDPR